MEPVKYLKDMFGVQEGTITDIVIDSGLSAIPTLGNMYQTYQIKKLEIRMKEHDYQLEIIKDKVESSIHESFYKSEVFPLIVNQIMNENEDQKVKVIIDGFEHIVDNDLHKIERIYHYYDVLAELRYSDIILFIKRYTPNEMRKERKLDIHLASQNERRSQEYKESQAIKEYQRNKFMRLGLLREDFSGEGGSSVKYNTGISEFGVRFLLMFSLKADEYE